MTTDFKRQEVKCMCIMDRQISNDGDQREGDRPRKHQFQEENMGTHLMRASKKEGWQPINQLTNNNYYYRLVMNIEDMILIFFHVFPLLALL